MTAAATATEILSQTKALSCVGEYLLEKKNAVVLQCFLSGCNWLGKHNSRFKKNCENLGTAKEREVSVIHR